MLLRTATKLSIGVLASALAAPAGAQSYHHAPPRAVAAPQFDTSAWPSLSSITSNLPFGNSLPQPPRAPRSAAPSRSLPAAPVNVIPASMSPGMPQGPSTVPPHLTVNTWTRSSASIPSAPVPYERRNMPAVAQAAGSPISSATYYAIAARQAQPARPQRANSPPPAPPATPPAAPPAAMAATQTASQLFAAGGSQPGAALAPPRPEPPRTAAMRPQPKTAAHRFTQRAAAAPSELPSMPSVEPMPAPQRPKIQMTSYARPARTAATPMQRPPVPPESPRVPSATPRPGSSLRPARPAARVQQASAAASAVPLSPPPAAPAAPPATLGQLPTMLANAQNALANGDYDLAEQYLDQARSYAPQDARPEALRARLYEARGQWDKAVETFDRLIILEPMMATWRLARARAFFQLGEYAKAIGDFRTVEATSARLSLNDYTLLCEAGFRQGDASTVHHALAMIEQINPEPHPRSELIRGLIAFRAGQGARARDILLRAAACWPRNEALTEALRRTSAVYYRDKRASNIASVESIASPMSAAESASLDLVKEYTPPVPKKSAAIWRRSDETPRSTTQSDASDGPARLEMVFAKPTIPADDGWRNASHQSNSDLGVIPAGYTTERTTSIGFR